MGSFQRRFLTLILTVLAAVCACSAQSNGTVKGILTDPEGKSAPDAAVTLVNEGTDQRVQTKTTAGGAYAFTFLPPGKYRFTAELAGFKDYCAFGDRGHRGNGND
jgi:carboxypeptidase family protein